MLVIVYWKDNLLVGTQDNRLEKTIGQEVWTIILHTADILGTMQPLQITLSISLYAHIYLLSAFCSSEHLLT